MNFKKLDQRGINGQKGVNLIERVVLGMGCAWHPSNASLDTGVDGVIEMCDPKTRRATNCVLRVQSKVISGRFTAETDVSFEYLCDDRDIDYWLGGNVPVILIVSRPESGDAYWVAVRSAFPSPEARKERRVFFRKDTQRFDEECRNRLFGLAVPTSLGLFFPPKQKRECLYSNLLRVKLVTPSLYIAATEFRNAKAVWSAAANRKLRISGEWFLSDRQILCVHNLREDPWRQLCEVGTVEEFGIAEWANSDDPARRRGFVRLLNACLRSKLYPRGIRHVVKDGLYYFLPSQNPKDLQREYSYQSIAKKSGRKVVRRYLRKDGSTKYFRHNAFKGRFQEYDERWFLEITPTYVFTADGREPYRYSDSYLKGIKQRERNYAVIGQVIMWARFLTEPAGLYDREYPYLAFEDLETIEVGQGIDDKEWLQREDEADRKAAGEGLNEEGLFT